MCTKNGNIKMLSTSCIKPQSICNGLERLAESPSLPQLGFLSPLSHDGPHPTWQCGHKNKVTFSLVSKVNREHSILYYPRPPSQNKKLACLPDLIAKLPRSQNRLPKKSCQQESNRTPLCTAAAIQIALWWGGGVENKNPALSYPTDRNQNFRSDPPVKSTNRAASLLNRKLAN